MEQQLQHAHRVAGYLGPRQAAEQRPSDFVGHLLGRELPLGTPHRADFRAGVDARRDVLDEPPLGGAIQNVLAGEAPLLVAGAGQPRWPDDVSRRIDVRQWGLQPLVDFHLAPVIDGDTDGFQAHVLRVAGTPVGPQQHVGLELLAGPAMQHHPVARWLDPLVLLLVTQNHTLTAQVVAQRIRDLVVEEGEEPVPGIDEINFQVQVGED